LDVSLDKQFVVDKVSSLLVAVTLETKMEDRMFQSETNRTLIKFLVIFKTNPLIFYKN